MTAALWALGAAALFSGSGAVDKYILEHRMGNPWAYYAFSTFVFTALFAAASAPLGALRPPADPWGVVAVGVLAWASIALYFLALRRGDISSVLPLGATRPLLAVPLAVLLLGEPYGPGVVGPILLVAAGGVLASWSEEGRLRGALRNPVLWLVLAANLLIVLSNTVANLVLRTVDPAQLTFWRYGVWCLLFLPLLALHAPAREGIRKNWRATLAPALLSGVLIYGMLLSLFQALRVSVQLTEGLLTSQALFGVAIGLLLSRLKPGLVEGVRPRKIYAIRGAGALLIVTGTAAIVGTG